MPTADILLVWLGNVSDYYLIEIGPRDIPKAISFLVISAQKQYLSCKQTADTTPISKASNVNLSLSLSLHDLYFVFSSSRLWNTEPHQNGYHRAIGRSGCEAHYKPIYLFHLSMYYTRAVGPLDMNFGETCMWYCGKWPRLPKLTLALSHLDVWNLNLRLPPI